MSTLVLVVNAGSSSLKYQLLDADAPDGSAPLASGLVERIGEDGGDDENVHHTVGDDEHPRSQRCADAGEAFAALLDSFAQYGPDLDDLELTAVGHRVVHGGERFADPVLVDDDVLAAVEELVPLAPLHNPANLEGIRLAREHFAGVPQVAVFDTAFHHDLPARAHTYAVPRAWREEHGVRRYGFHGTSYAFVSRRAAQLLGRPLEQTAMVVLHLGNGASAAAILGGRSIDTSMGLGPVEGLVMGTRSGDLDPAVPGHLARSGIGAEEFDRDVSTRSGLLALAGRSDVREVVAAARGGDADAELALGVMTYRLRKYVGAYAAALGRLDAVVLTGGVGEHAPVVRSRALSGMEILGIHLDQDANDRATGGEHVVSTPGSPVTVLVVPTDEEREIARQAAAVVRSSDAGQSPATS
ncbi:acetate/propionate family kinase [Lapillicoccus jejuensis]|uniref:Acetate kinase n=1 Tax=Lapillicoccus jejuensis TaxID=402171 RepID=A0A542E4E9_9MICO|nr:acetate kinase [Lapillicoccus jejuensis]TQJ10228.1 acetate kinase [Lapillicoccus jejuensis]